MPSAVMVTGREALMGPPLWRLGALSQGGILPVRSYFTQANLLHCKKRRGRLA